MRRRARFAALAATAAALFSIAVGLGVALGAVEAWREVAAQRYGALGFARSAFVVYRDALLAGAGAGARWGAALATAALALGALSAWRGWAFDVAGRARLASSRAAVAWLAAALTLASCAALFLLEREREWIGAAQIAHALAVALAGVAALLAIDRYARDPRYAVDLRRRASVAAALPALAVLLAAGFWINRDALERPWDPATWLLDALLAAVALLLFAWGRARALAELRGTPRSSWTGPLALGALAGALLGAAALAAAAFGSSLAPPSLPAERPLNVLLVGIDTLRADATSLAGASLRGRDTTPNLRGLAARGVLFRNAVSQAPWTMPAFASVLTGKYPHEHGAYSLSGGLRAGETTLAEVLREAGYATRAVVSHTYVGTVHGFQQGFDVFDESNAQGHRAVTSRAVTDLALRALDETSGGPFFLFAHYFDVHYEYLDHADFPWADGYRGWLAEELDFENLIKSRHLLGDAEKEWLVDLYEEEVAWVDREVGRLLAGLEERGLSGTTLVVVVGDHGEEFLDHGNFGHTTTLFQEQLHVPLIVAAPGREPAEVASVVETRALFGTVLDVLGLPLAAPARERSLLRPSRDGDGEGKAFSIVWLPDAKLEWGKHMRISALRDGPWKLIRDATRDATLLFDLANDPRELRDLSAERPDLAGSMRATLETWTQEQQNRGGAATQVKIDPDLARRLHEMGYL